VGLFDFFGRVSPLDGESNLPLFRASDLGYFNMGSTSLGDGVCIVTTTRVLPPRSSFGREVLVFIMHKIETQEEEFVS